MRSGRWALSILALAALTPPTAAFAQRLGQAPGGPLGVLAATSHQVRAGDGVTVEATICPKGQTVAAVAQRTVRDGESTDAASFDPLNLDAISLSQTDSGSSFTITAEEARTSLWFRLDCADGTSAATTDAVTVYPPSGEFWWTFNTPGRFAAAAGTSLALQVMTMDCDTSFEAEADLYSPDGGEPLLHVVAPFHNDGSVALQLLLPADAPSGVYVAEVTCSSVKGGGITDGVPVYVTASAHELPPTGRSASAATLAAWILGAGCLLLVGARRLRTIAG